MRLLIATFALMSTAAKSSPKIDVDRVVEAICQIEGGSWGTPGGRGCMHHAAWTQHSDLAYQASMTERLALPVYRQHVEWLIAHLPAHHIRVTPAAIYACWHEGLEGGSAIIHGVGMPEDATRCENLYRELTASPSPAGASSVPRARD